jgi:hypothetical protein
MGMITIAAVTQHRFALGRAIGTTSGQRAMIPRRSAVVTA